jgi:ribosomal protein S7
MKRNIKIKNKIINHLMKHGKKQTSEKIFSKSIKELQKSTLKRTKDVIILSIKQTTPIYKMHFLTQKKRKNKTIKEIPTFIKTSGSRTSLAIKFIVQATRKKNRSTYKNLKEEILLSSQALGDSVKVKQDLQEAVLKKKKLFKYYKW